MAAKVDIFNRALIKLGASVVLSPGDDTKEARTLSSMYDIVRDAELRRNTWNFAVKRISLAASTTAPDWGFNSLFPLPADFLRLLDIEGSWHDPGLNDYISSDTSLFRIEADGIATSLAAPLRIRYTARISDESKYDPAFVEALACRLAAEACEALTQSNTKRQLAVGEYVSAIGEAIRSNAIENPPMALSDDAWVMSRL